jgi:Zn-finger nucleic acid-binding protein
MKCPRCNLPLTNIDLGKSGGEYASVVIDQCPECEGVWLDKGELDQRDESAWTDAEALDFEVVSGNGEAVLCPKCSVALTRIAPKEVPGLVIDRCPDCLGFWLDPGELETVQALVADLDSAKLDQMTHLQRPPDSSWLSWALHCFVKQWKERSEQHVRDQMGRYT